jgi:hypothetical protein
VGSLLTTTYIGRHFGRHAGGDRSQFGQGIIGYFGRAVPCRSNVIFLAGLKTISQDISRLSRHGMLMGEGLPFKYSSTCLARGMANIPQTVALTHFFFQIPH